MPSPAAHERSPEKQRLRALVRAARRSRGADQRLTDAARLARTVTASPLVAGAAVVAAYESTTTEPGTRPLRTALAGRGMRVLLPVVTGTGVLAWRWDTPPANGTERGTATSGGTGAGASASWGPPLLRLADVVLLPALAVDAAGRRLGQGGGHYDRTLAALLASHGEHHRRPALVALVHDDEVLEAGAVAAEAHDVRVDAAATPGRWVPLG